MNELSEKDWELVNAYHDGELDAAERQALEARLQSEPLLRHALKDVASVSASLGALRPETRPEPPQRSDVAANRNRRPARWLASGAMAAAIALAAILGPKLVAEPSAFDIHAEFTAQSFLLDGGDMRLTSAAGSVDVPDLSTANLAPVALSHDERWSVVHYAGRNRCRLSYFRGTSGLGEQTPGAGNQVAAWSTADNMHHMIVATGMDPGKFDAISAYLKLVTQRQAGEQMMAALANTTANAEECVG